MEYSRFADNIKKLDCTITKLPIIYNQADSRCWSAIINCLSDSIIITHHINKYDYATQLFDILSSKKIITDVELEDVYDTVDLLIQRQETLIENLTEE